MLKISLAYPVSSSIYSIGCKKCEASHNADIGGFLFSLEKAGRRDQSNTKDEKLFVKKEDILDIILI